MRCLICILTVYMVAAAGMFGLWGDLFGMFSHGHGAVSWAMFGHAGALTVAFLFQVNTLAGALLRMREGR